MGAEVNSDTHQCHRFKSLILQEQTAFDLLTIYIILKLKKGI